MEIPRNAAGGGVDEPPIRPQPHWQTVPAELPAAVPIAPSAAVQQAALSAPVRPPAPPVRPAPPTHQAPPAHHDTADLKVKAPGRRPSTRMVVTSGFGKRVHPITHQVSSHDGIDLSAAKGTRILASRSGRVTFAGEAGGYGLLVIVDHGQGVETRYGHASALLVKAGQEVKAGQAIAKVGSTGRSTGPHLHFEVRRQGRPVDPWPLLAGGRSRAWRPPL
jgi:murein DD-endopeptidase MepM/ murein hydrolase activator NlpD